jgi:hypothetical protein
MVVYIIDPSFTSIHGKVTHRDLFSVITSENLIPVSDLVNVVCASSLQEYGLRIVIKNADDEEEHLFCKNDGVLDNEEEKTGNADWYCSPLLRPANGLIRSITVLANLLVFLQNTSRLCEDDSSVTQCFIHLSNGTGFP